MVSDVNYIKEDIKTPFQGKCLYMEETCSTMDMAREFAESGTVDHGFLIRAGRQTSGRGRGTGRRWESPEGENLLFTILIRRENLRIPLTAFPLAAGLAVSRTLEKYGLSPAIKWPNDILCGGNKICGILCESVGDFLSAGIGLNCRQKVFPDNLRTPATSLSLLTGKEFFPGKVLEDLLPELNQVITGECWRKDVEARLFGIDRKVRFEEGLADNGKIIELIIAGIGESGELRTTDSLGKNRNVYTGEILYV